MSFVPRAMSGVLALYHLADVNDASGNSHTLTNTGTVTFGPGKLGDCALLGASNSTKYLSHDDGLGEDLSGPAAVSIWFRVLTAPGTDEVQTVFRWGSTTGTARFFLLFYADVSGTKKLRFLPSDATQLDYEVTLSIDRWYKLDINLDSTCNIYLDGNLIISGSRGTTTTAVDRLVLGANTAFSYMLKGDIDEAVFFNAVRSVANIRRRYAFERGLLA